MSAASLKKMVQPNNVATVKTLIASSALLLISACSGDGRPFTEAVEANNLNLKSISIEPPVGRLNNLVVSPGELFTLSLKAIDQKDKVVALSSLNRRWSVNRPDVINIDESGNVFAEGEGTAIVSVRIGGVASPGFTITVSDEAFDSIERIEGKDSLERCLPMEYQAIGRFLPVNGVGEGSTRGLFNVNWSVVEAEPLMGTALKPIDGFSTVNGVNVGPLTLRAQYKNKSLDKVIDVKNTLQEITVEPESDFFVLGRKLQLSAKGYYVDDGEERTDVNITDSVTWKAEAETTVFSVGNSINDKGVVTPKTVGRSQLTASCGDLVQQKTVTVEANSASTSGLTIEGDDPRVLPLINGGVQLRVSTGTSYDSNNQKTGVADWLVLEGKDVAAFNGNTRGFITPLKVGTAKIQVTHAGRIATLTIQVN